MSRELSRHMSYIESFSRNSSLCSTQTLREIAESVSTKFLLITTKSTPLEMGMFALDRILSVAEDTKADMLYADHYELVSGKDGEQIRRRHPLIDCQKGALRDDFDFGSVLVFKTSSFPVSVPSSRKTLTQGAVLVLSFLSATVTVIFSVSDERFIIKLSNSVETGRLSK